MTPSPACSAVPQTISGYNDNALPDPFTFANGSKVTTAAEWECRRNEIISFIQAYEAGVLPPRPPQLSGSFSNNALTVTAGGVGSSSNTINWTSTITYPTGTAPSNGWPLLIGYDGGSIPVPSGVALLTFNTETMAQQDSTASRGLGLFYNLYGANASASALTAWTWGVSRIIDVLEVTPAAKIDTTKIAITGCSRDGKGALTTGAFEPRIALTIAQESGSGGAACWRLSLYEQEEGSVVQTATEIVTENVWFSTTFNNYVNNLSVLPFDHHLLAALIAPRGLLALDNTDFVWLSPVSNYGCMSAARSVYEALGVEDNMGFMQQGGHAHCAFPSNQTTFLDAFFDKFLLGQTGANTDVFLTNNVWNGVTWVASNWTNWATPTLS
ncbi:carbohydrate esterase family 15 protein [Hydnomerulius pinastri MD-312]|uniref:(4-O-methyl)-D-glucuronate--lignin esterase n=1 Tax=Hydnomerulius pinastri MD-312 TaxID=994086 RepID=A0A0C9W941_9AGAM|nr:carbohydrate esterase family 15 protein [Hydnomerulius pinastri MD-312]